MFIERIIRKKYLLTLRQKNYKGHWKVSKASIALITCRQRSFSCFACWVRPFKNETFLQKSTPARTAVSVTCSVTLTNYDVLISIPVLKTQSKYISINVSLFFGLSAEMKNSASFPVEINEVVFCIYHLHISSYYWWMRGIMTSKVFILYLEIYISHPL